MSNDCHYKPLNESAAGEAAELTPFGKTSNDEDAKRNCTRVFKKSSPNSKLTVYIGKRDFIDYQTKTEPIDGVILVDPEYMKDRKVFAQVLAAFRYGREDLDMLGLAFRKDLFISSLQVYPPVSDDKRAKPLKDVQLTQLQERLIKKLGPNAYPFYFQLPARAPASITLQPAPGDTGKPCGVDYELTAYVADNVDDKIHKRNSVVLAIRKLTYAPEEPAPQPTAEGYKEFIMSPGSLRLEATLDKEKYYHGESIAINILVDNNTNKQVKKVKISVIQIADIMLFSKASYKCTVAELESEEGFPILPSQTGFCKVYYLTPLLSNNRDKRGLALDGKIKHEDTNLASSAIDLSVELPFTLTHSKPPEEMATPMVQRRSHGDIKAAAASSSAAAAGFKHEGGDGLSSPVDPNLILIETNGDGYYANQEDDFIFEDFARLRLKNYNNVDETEA